MWKREGEAKCYKDKSSSTPPPHVCLQPSDAKLAAHKRRGLFFFFMDWNLHTVGPGSRSFGTEVKVTPWEHAGQVAAFLLQFFLREMPVFDSLFFLVHLCNSPKSWMKKSSTSHPRVGHIQRTKQLKFVCFFGIVSTHLSHGGICPFGKPLLSFSPAKLIQLSIQCFWSINEDSLCSVLYYYTLATHMQFALCNSRLYPVVFGNQRWLCSSGSYCSSFLF